MTAICSRTPGFTPWRNYHPPRSVTSESNPATMKKLLCLTSAITLLMTTGCYVSDEHRHGHYRGHERHEVHEEIRVVHPEIVVRPPEIIIR